MCAFVETRQILSVLLANGVTAGWIPSVRVLAKCDGIGDAIALRFGHSHVASSDAFPSSVSFCGFLTSSYPMRIGFYHPSFPFNLVYRSYESAPAPLSKTHVPALAIRECCLLPGS